MSNKRRTIVTHHWTDWIWQMNNILFNETNRKNVVKKTFFGCSYSYWWINGKQRNINAKANASSLWFFFLMISMFVKRTSNKVNENKKNRIFVSKNKSNFVLKKIITIDVVGRKNHEKQHCTLLRKSNHFEYRSKSIDNNYYSFSLIMSQMTRFFIGPVSSLVRDEIFVDDAVYHSRKKKQFLSLLLLLFESDEFDFFIVVFYSCFSFQGKKRGKKSKWKISTDVRTSHSSLLLVRITKVNHWHPHFLPFRSMNVLWGCRRLTFFFSSTLFIIDRFVYF